MPTMATAIPQVEGDRAEAGWLPAGSVPHSTAVFRGTLSLENNGGFASVHSLPARSDLSDCDARLRLSQPPQILVCASVTGNYADRGHEVLEERSGSGTGFLPEVCVAGEAATGAARHRGKRRVVKGSTLRLPPAARAWDGKLYLW